MAEELIKTTEEKMKKSIEATRKNFATIRTGRASPHLLDKVVVEYYGTKVPLKQLAGVSVPESRLIVVQPYDKGVFNEVVKAIQKSDLGLNPMAEGGVIRLNVPQLTEERRKELVKLLKKGAEEGKVALRNIRHEAMDMIKGQKEKISEDKVKFMGEQIQKLIEKYSKEVDKILTEKEKEVMQV